MSTLDPSTRLRKSARQLSAVIDGEVAAMQTERSRYYTMDVVGSRIWALVEDEPTVDDVVAVLLAEFDVDARTCRAEVVRYLHELLDYGLIELVTAQ
jgi:hypothetical protein